MTLFSFMGPVGIFELGYRLISFPGIIYSFALVRSGVRATDDVLFSFMRTWASVLLGVLIASAGEIFQSRAVFARHSSANLEFWFLVKLAFFQHVCLLGTLILCIHISIQTKPVLPERSTKASSDLTFCQRDVDRATPRLIKHP